MRIPLSLLVLLALLLATVLPESIDEKIKRIKKRKKEGKEMPEPKKINRQNMTRQLHFEYWLKTDSVVYDVIGNKERSKMPSIVANLTFDILHNSEGHTLARWELVECHSGNCGNPPPAYVEFTRGGNNIHAVYMDLKNHPGYVARWNFLLAAIAAIYTPALPGEGDIQVVPTQYGLCRAKFTKPKDKHFRREIGDCELDGALNFTRFDGIQPVKFYQDVQYLQNTKVDADIVFIDSVEEITFRTPFDNRFGFAVETRNHIEMMNRTIEWVDRVCTHNVSVHDCATNVYGLTKISDKIYENVLMGPKDTPTEFESTLASLRQVYAESAWEEQHSQLFSKLVQALHAASHEEIEKAFRDDENYEIRFLLANALGAIGGVDEIPIARDVIIKDFKRNIHDYLFGVAHRINFDDKFNKHLMYWLMELKKTDDPLYWHLADTVATVLRRDCLSSPSSVNACEKEKRQIVLKLVSEVSDCTTNECHEKALQVLRNIPLPTSYRYAKQQLCRTNSSFAVQTAALQLIERVSPSFYDSELVGLLMRLIRNACPHPTSTGEAQLAADILVKTVTEHQNAGTLLLRSESLFPVDQELWAYIYQAIDESRKFDGAKDDFWKQLRSFRVFRPNYVHRALHADSNTFKADFIEYPPYKARMSSSSEFVNGVFKGSRFDMSLVKRKQENSLFELIIGSSGLESYVDPDHSLTDVTTPRASVRLSVLGHALLPFEVFNGHHSMMDTVMSANGQTINAFKGAALIRSFSSAYPLLSGLSVSLDIFGSVAFQVSGSAEVSLWNRDSITKMDVDLSLSLTSSATLLLDGLPLHSVVSSLSSVPSINTNIDALFVERPYNFCLAMSRSDTPYTLKVEKKTFEGRRRPLIHRRRRRRVYPGETYGYDRSTIQQCRRLGLRRGTW